MGGVAGVAVAPSSTPSRAAASPGFAGVAVSSLKPDGAGVAAGLRVGDHVLSVNASAATATPTARGSCSASRRRAQARAARRDVRDRRAQGREGRLGLAFVQAESRHRGVAGTVIGEVAERSAADDAKLRTGDLIVAVDGALAATTATRPSA